MTALQISRVNGEPVDVDVSNVTTVCQLRTMVADTLGTFKPCLSLAQQCIVSDEMAINEFAAGENVFAIINYELHGACVTLRELDDQITQKNNAARVNLQDVELLRDRVDELEWALCRLRGANRHWGADRLRYCKIESNLERDRRQLVQHLAQRSSFCSCISEAYDKVFKVVESMRDHISDRLRRRRIYYIVNCHGDYQTCYDDDNFYSEVLQSLGLSRDLLGKLRRPPLDVEGEAYYDTQEDFRTDPEFFLGLRVYRYQISCLPSFLPDILHQPVRGGYLSTFIMNVSMNEPILDHQHAREWFYDADYWNSALQDFYDAYYSSELFLDDCDDHVPWYCDDWCDEVVVWKPSADDWCDDVDDWLEASGVETELWYAGHTRKEKAHAGSTRKMRSRDARRIR